MESTNGSWPGKLPHLVLDNEAPATLPNLRSLMASHTTEPAQPGSLAAKAQKTYAYIGEGFYDRNSICLIDAKAVFNIPQHAQDYIAHAQPREVNNIYTNIIGENDLLDALAENGKKLGLHYAERENIVITAGAVNGFYGLCHALCQPGDVILTLCPSYILFAHAVRALGAELVLVPAQHNGSHFSITAAALEKKIAEIKRAGKTIKALLVINPSNIDSRCWLADEIGQLAPVINRHDLLVIEDRVYDGLQYDRPADHAFFANHPLLAPRTVTLDSVSKRYGATQWRIGWVYAPKELADAVRSAVMQTVWSPNALYQKATALLFREKGKTEAYLEASRQEYKIRRDLCLFVLNGREKYEQLDRNIFTPVSALKQMARDNNFSLKDFEYGIYGFQTPVLPQCGMFLLIQASNELMRLLPEEYADRDLILARLLYLHARIVVLPPCELTLPEEFNLFRMEFGVEMDDLVQAFYRLQKFTNDLKAMDKAAVVAMINAAIEGIAEIPEQPDAISINQR